MNSSWLKLTIATLLLCLPPLLTQSAIAEVAGTPQIAQSTRDRKTDANHLLRQGRQQDETSQFQEALQSYQQALSIYRELGDRAREGATLHNIGAVYRKLGQYPEALKHFQQALVIRREVGDRAGEGTTLHNIGAVYSKLGQYPQALEHCQQALVIRREVGDRVGEGATLRCIGEAYSRLGLYPQALKQFQQALVISREVNDRAGEGATLHNIGLVYRKLGQYSQALEQLQQALVIRREVGDRTGEGNTLSNIGAVYSKLEQHPQALEQLRQALVIRREVSDRTGEGSTLHNMGVVYRRLRQYPQALEQFRQALIIRKEVGDRAGEGTTLNNIGAVYSKLKQYPRALELCKQALIIFREVGDRAGEASALSNIGYILFASGHAEAATKNLFEAVKALESLRSSELEDTDKVSLFDTQFGTYEVLQQALISQNQTETALEVAEWGRARAFAELLSSRSSSQSDRQASSVTKPMIAQIKQIAREQNTTLVEYSIARAPIRVEGREEEQQAKLYIWVVKPTGEIAFRSVNLATIDPPFNALMDFTFQAFSIGSRGSTRLLPPPIGRQPGQIAARLQQLYQVLIDPIADLLPTNPNDHVIFVPQDKLFQVPFPALQTADGKYLIESHTILTAPSIQILSLIQHSSPSKSIDPSEMLVVGNPTMPFLPAVPPDLPQQLSALPGAEQEAIDIAKQFHTQPLLGNAATETTVVQRMAKASIIHLATHGLLEYGDPKSSGVQDVPGAIALAASGQEDGLLTSNEILNLKLNGSLVVLSACDTGRGDITGDGVIGLSRSLLSAGASSVIVSLWNVQDDSTAALMAEFYTQLRQQPDRAQALRQAMLKTRAEYPDPIDWAAFTLIGKTDNLELSI